MSVSAFYQLILSCIVVLGFSAMASGQVVDYKMMMEDHRVNVFDVIDEAEKHFDQHGRGKGSGYKGFSRWKYNMLMRFPDGNRSGFNPMQAYNEYNNYISSLPVGRAAGGNNCWTELGPDNNDDILATDWNPGVGRVDALEVHDTYSDTIYLGSRMGGFWKTEDGGTTWRSTTQDLVAVGVLDIEIHPVNRNVIWIIVRNGTGYSLGLLKSTDFGETWSTTSMTFTQTSYTRLYDIWISRENPNIMYCSSNDGLYVSKDAGNTWTLPYTGIVSRMALRPFDADYVYIVDRTYDPNIVRFSSDTGQTWTDGPTLVGNSNRTLWLAVSDINPDAVYAASNNGIWLSTDSGTAYVQKGTPPNSLMEFGVSSTELGRVLCGGLDTYMSSDSGNTHQRVLWWLSDPGLPDYIHADSRETKSRDGVFFMGSDGYLGKSLDSGLTWSILNTHGTPIREFYCIGNSTMRAGHVIGGSQDNGTSILRDGVWSDWIGADGMECHIDRSNPKIWFGTIQYGSLRRTTTDGGNAQNVRPTSNGNWVTPSILDPSNDNTILIGYRALYKSNDNGSNWDTLYDFTSLGSNIDFIAIAESDSSRLYLAENSSDQFVRSDDGGQTWTNYFGSLPPNNSISDIAVHPTDPNTVAVSTSGYTAANKVFMSTNGGVTWNNITSNLPNVPANTLIFEGDRDNRIYLGMDVGMYYYDNTTGGNWNPYQDSMPLVDVRDLEIHRGANLLQAATYGRGAWKAPLKDRGTAPQILAIDMVPNDTDRPHDRDSVQILAEIVDDVSVTEAKIHWGTDGTFPYVLNMTQFVLDSFVTVAQIPPQPVGTRVNYKVMAVDNTSDTTFSDKIVYKVQKATPCVASGSFATGADYITSVELHTMTNGPTMQDYYSDYSGVHIVELFDDTTYQLGVQILMSVATDTVYAWIDWNDNIEFEANELIVMSEIAVGPLNYSYGTITVPPTAVLDDTLYMRVRNINSATAFSDPCNVYLGEVEDYGIVARHAPPAADFIYSPDTVCVGDSVYFTNQSSGSLTQEWRITSFTDTLTSTANNPVFHFPSADIYTIRLIVSDGITSDTVIVVNGLAVNPLPTITASATSTTVCDGQSVSVFGSGGVMYDWNFGVQNGVPFSPSVSRLYTVEGYDANGCMNTASIQIDVDPLPNVVLNPFSPSTVCHYVQSIPLPTGNPPGGVYSGIGVVANLFYPPLAGVGTHTVLYEYTDDNDCRNEDTTSITVQKCVEPPPTGISEAGLKSNIEIFPNPNTGQFQVEFTSTTLKMVKAKITDALGKSVWTGELDPTKKNFVDLSSEGDGIYLFHVHLDDGVIVKKIIKK